MNQVNSRSFTPKLASETSLHGVMKGGAGFASKDSPLVHVMSSCMVCLQYYIILSFSMEGHGSIPGGLPVSFQGSVLTPAFICAVPARCQVQS